MRRCSPERTIPSTVKPRKESTRVGRGASAVYSVITAAVRRNLVHRLSTNYQVYLDLVIVSHVKG